MRQSDGEIQKSIVIGSRAVGHDHHPSSLFPLRHYQQPQRLRRLGARAKEATMNSDGMKRTASTSPGSGRDILFRIAASTYPTSENAATLLSALPDDVWYAISEKMDAASKDHLNSVLEDERRSLQLSPPNVDSATEDAMSMETELLRPDARNHMLVDACAIGRLNLVRKLLSFEGAHLCDRRMQEEGFRRACANGHLQVTRELMRSRRVDPTSKNNQSIRLACSGGHLPVVRELLPLTGNCHLTGALWPEALRGAVANGHVRVIREVMRRNANDVRSMHDSETFRQACAKGHLVMVGMLLSLQNKTQTQVHPAIIGRPAIGRDDQSDKLSLYLQAPWKENLTAQRNKAMADACRHGHLSVVRQLLSLGASYGVDVSVEDSYAFRVACENGHLSVVRELLSLKGFRRVDPAAKGNYAIRKACLNGHLPVVRELLSLEGDRRVDPAAETNSPIRWACQKGHLAVVCELLSYPRVDPTVKNHEAVRKACANGHLSVVRKLLSLEGERRIDPTALDHECFRMACAEGSSAVVDELLSLDGDRRVDPTSKDNEAIRWACLNGHLSVVRQLLALDGDRRVDPTARSNCAFRCACLKGHLQVVRELLSLEGDRRVDPTANNNEALREACRHGHQSVVHELLSLEGNRRVDPSDVCPSHLRLCSSFKP